jgi:hypothetical protein
MKSEKWLISSMIFFVAFLLLILIPSIIAAVHFKEPVLQYLMEPLFNQFDRAFRGDLPSYKKKDDLPSDTTKLLTIAQTLGILITAIGTLSSLFIAWRLDCRQARELVLKEKELSVKITELEQKLAAYKTTLEASEKIDPP